MSGWGCAHEVKGTCSRVGGRPCDPGMKGCILAGRFRFSNQAKNRPSKPPPPKGSLADAPASRPAAEDAPPPAPEE